MAATSQQTFLVFETVVCALHLDLNEAFFFHATLTIWSTLKQTGKCHSPDKTFQRKMHRVIACGAWQIPKSEGCSEIRLRVGPDAGS